MPQLKKCSTPFCRNKIKQRNYCDKCRVKMWRKNNPIRSSYNINKANAKKRGHEFTISFEYFEKFCYETNYIGRKGSSGTCYTVDRLDPRLGYIEGNIGCKTRSENSKKGTKILYYDWSTRMATVATYYPPEDNSDNPF